MKEEDKDEWQNTIFLRTYVNCAIVSMEISHRIRLTMLFKMRDSVPSDRYSQLL